MSYTISGKFEHGDDVDLADDDQLGDELPQTEVVPESRPDADSTGGDPDMEPAAPLEVIPPDTADQGDGNVDQGDTVEQGDQ